MKSWIHQGIGLIIAMVFAIIQIGFPVGLVFAGNFVRMDFATDGILQIQMIEEPMDSDFTETSIRCNFAAASETEQFQTYAEDHYASYHGYDVLNDAEKEVYMELKCMAHEFYSSDEDVPQVTYSSGVMYYVAKIQNPSYALSAEDIAKVLSLFRMDNPLYFFVGNYLLYNTMTISGQSYITQFYISCSWEYADGKLRQEKIQAIADGIAQAEQCIMQNDSAFEKARAAHDWICDNIEYQFAQDGVPDESLISHTNLGVFDRTYRYGVCEGYAKAFQLLMNGAGIDNFYLIGYGGTATHAWNTAKMDDGYYYYFDVTWDDTARTDDYFASGNDQFSLEHTAFTVEDKAWQYLYDIPDVPSDAYEEQLFTTYTENEFVYRLYDTYAVLIAYIGDANEVTVPENVSGLPVTQIKGAFANNSILQRVHLPNTLQVLSYSVMQTNNEGAFENCTSLQYVQLPSQMKRIGYCTFYGCTLLEDLSIPTMVNQIGPRAFDCENLSVLRVYARTCSYMSVSSVAPDVVLYGYPNSTTQSYAQYYNRYFYELELLEDTAPQEMTTTTTIATTVNNVTSTTTTTLPVTHFTSEATIETDSTTESVVVQYQIKYGDINRDGVYALRDVVLINLYILGQMQADEVQIASMDCFKDGRIDTRDGRVLLLYLIQSVTELPVIAV